ncbi:hypothetical protein Tco_0020416 [Tanacetum coccineum]
MAAPVISISSDLSDESVGSSISRVILIGSIPVEVPVAPEVRAAAVTSPAGVLELDTHSSSEADPSESSLPPVPVALMVSPFLCSNDSESDTEMLERHVSSTPHNAMLARWRSRVVSRSSSPTTYTLEIPTAPIPPAPSAIVAPFTDIISPVDAPPGIRRRRAILIRPGQDIPIKSSPSDSPATTLDRHSHSPSHYAGLSRKRCRFKDSISLEDSIEEDIEADVLANIEADATSVEVAADIDVEAGIDAGIGMEVDVGVDIEDKDEGEAESSDRGTMEVGVDVVAGIDIPYGMLMPDVIMTITRSGMTPEAIEELINQRVMEALATYEVNRAAELVVESQIQNGDDGDNRNGKGNGNGNGGGNGDGVGRGNGNGNGGGNGNGNPNRNDRGVMPVARECTYHDFVKCQPLNFKGTKGVVWLTRWFEKMEIVFHISNCPERYQVKYATCTLLNSALTWWNAHKRKWLKLFLAVRTKRKWLKLFLEPWFT